MSTESQSPIVARDALDQRTLPEMILSQATNPLTAPISMPEGLTAAERANRRFAVDQNAIVTGGAGNLAIAAIRGLLEHGATGIAIFDLRSTIISSDAEIQSLKTEFPQANIETMEVDVTDEKVVEKAVEGAKSKLGPITMLLCFAGVVACTHAVETSPSEWRRVLDINATGSFLCAQAVAKHMVTQDEGGSVVFIASMAGQIALFPQPQVAYNVSKAGVVHMTKSLAAEWARYGIRVNSISPGYMDTILNAGDGLAGAKKKWFDRTPLGRMGTPDELVGAIILLCSRYGGRYITGENITVDGGTTVF